MMREMGGTEVGCVWLVEEGNERRQEAVGRGGDTQKEERQILPSYCLIARRMSCCIYLRSWLLWDPVCVCVCVCVCVF